MPTQPPITDHRSLLTRAWPWLAAAASGVLLTLCYPRFDQGRIVWFALTPLIAALFFANHGGPRAWLRKAALGYVTGVVFFASTFWWLNTLAGLYHNALLLSLPVLLALILGLYFAAWSWFVGAVLVRDEAALKFPRSAKNLAIGFAGALAWVALEWTRGWLFGGFGWNPLGVALHGDLVMIQIAEFTGVSGLSLLIVFGNLLSVIIVRRLMGELGPAFLKRVRWEFSFTMAVLALVFAFGVRRLLEKDTGPAVPLRAVAVQPNIPQTDKFDPDAEQKVFAQLDGLTALAALTKPAPHLILWPESATPRSMFADDVNYDFVMQQAVRGDFGLLIGTTDFDPARAEDYNAAVLITQRGKQLQAYHKMHLVPFGEYLPLRPIFSPLVGQLVPADFARGRDFTLLELAEPKLSLSALICFEDTVGDLARQFVGRGAQVLVNITNDGWFAQSPAAEQHLANALFRAVENRRPLIRCGNTGVTCSVDPQGRVTPWLPLFQQGFAARELRVPTAGPVTFYTRHGEWLAHLGCVATALVLLWRVRPRT